jgi:small subunit ribosomal protein S20
VAHSLSAKKRIRQNAKRRTLNRARKSALKSKVRKVTEAFLHRQPAEAEKNMHEAVRSLDRAASRGTVHRNAAARKKSRMIRRLASEKKKSAGGA